MHIAYSQKPDCSLQGVTVKLDFVDSHGALHKRSRELLETRRSWVDTVEEVARNRTQHHFFKEIMNTQNEPSLDSLLASLNNVAPAKKADPAENTEVIEAEAPVTEGDLEAAAPPAGDSEEVIDTGAALGATDTEPPKTKAKSKKASAKPAVSDEEKAAAKAAKDAERAEKAAKKTADKEAAKLAREAAKAERAAKKAAEPKPEAKPKVYFGANKVGLMEHKMGAERLAELMVFTTTEAALTGDALTAKQKENTEMIRKMGSKVQNRANYVITYMHKGGKLNEVIRRAFVVLKRDGKLTTGEEGSYIKELLAKPYDISTARAAGNNTINLLKQLSVIVAGEKGEYVPNADSLIYQRVTADAAI
jgi:hypothetical protein